MLNYWPQYLMCLYFAAALFSAVLLHGIPKTGKYNAWLYFWEVVGLSIVLYFGGFWK